MKPLTTTVARLREVASDQSLWDTKLKRHGYWRDCQKVAYAQLVEILGLDDALWAMKAEPSYWRTWRLFARFCTRKTRSPKINTVDTTCGLKIAGMAWAAADAARLLSVAAFHEQQRAFIRLTS
jgi:hypothetical protein